MIINNLELFFDRQEGDNLFFKTKSGEEISITKNLLSDFSEKDKKVYLNLDLQESSVQVQDVLNEILKTNKE